MRTDALLKAEAAIASSGTSPSWGDAELETLLVALEEIQLDLLEEETASLINDVADWYEGLIAGVFASPCACRSVPRVVQSNRSLDELLNASLQRAQDALALRKEQGCPKLVEVRPSAPIL